MRHDEENQGGGGGGGGGGLPPGFRFHPTDEELITYYLSNKVSDFGFSPIAIADVDLNKCEPWDLPGKASMGEKEWYFFSMRDRKYPTGLRTNRATEAGYWKTTGKDKEIFGGGGMVVGMKKTLVFYRGRAPKGEKTNWVMHEYRLETKHAFKPHKEEWVVCRVFRKSNAMKKHQRASSPSPQALESPCVTNTTIANNELGDFDILNPNTMVSSSSNGGGINKINTCMQNYYNNENSTTLPLLPWPPTLLSSNLSSNLSSLNTLLLRALQLRGNSLYQPLVDQNQDTTSKRTSDYVYMSQGLVDNTISNFGDVSMDTTSNFAPIETPTSMFLNSVNNQQQHQPYKDLSNMW
ncbi:unnamed protein product [Cuscuta campestris]|uniref:NAC domain-containing protein n=1 Tax=Cuscuta campestris TaxID=132261 RepID=A0A484MDX4_9ASTE|nr:unnamed protein product [Cuscuta campestris]